VADVHGVLTEYPEKFAPIWAGHGFGWIIMVDWIASVGYHTAVRDPPRVLHKTTGA
jgi:hypothetical protein